MILAHHTHLLYHNQRPRPKLLELLRHLELLLVPLVFGQSHFFDLYKPVIWRAIWKLRLLPDTRDEPFRAEGFAGGVGFGSEDFIPARPSALSPVPTRPFLLFCVVSGPKFLLESVGAEAFWRCYGAGGGGWYNLGVERLANATGETVATVVRGKMDEGKRPASGGINAFHWNAGIELLSN